MTRASQALRARIDAYYAGTEPDDLLSPEAAAEAEEVYRENTETPESRALLATFHMARYEAADDPGFATGELAAAVELAKHLDEDLRPYALAVVFEAISRVTAGEAPQDILALDEAMRPMWARLFFTLGSVWRPDGTDVVVLDRLVAAMSIVLALVPSDHGGRRAATALLGSYRTQRARLTGNRDDVDAAATLVRGALAGMATDDPQWPEMYHLLCNALLVTYELDGSPQARVELAQALIDGIDVGADFGAELAELGWWIARDDRESAQPGNAEQALVLARLGILAAPPGDPNRPAALFSLGVALGQRAGDRASTADSDAAVGALQEMVALLDGDESRVKSMDIRDPAGQLGIARTFLGRFLLQRYELAGERADLDEAVRVGRLAVDLLPPDNLPYTMSLSYLGVALFEHHQLSADPAELDEAADVLSRAVTGEGSPSDIARALSMLCAVQYTRFRLSGVPADIESAVEFGKRAVATAPADDPSLVDWLGNLSNALRIRYSHFGGVEDLTEAIEITRRAAAATPAGHADRARACQNFSSAVLDRYVALGDPEDLTMALTAIREAHSVARQGTYGFALVLSNLGLTLTYRYEREGRPGDLDEAISHLRDAVDRLTKSRVERSLSLNNLAAASHIRYQLIGSGQDLRTSIDASRQSLLDSTPGSTSGVTASLNLGSFLADLFDLTGDREALDEAVDLLKRTTSVVGAAERPSVYINLAKALRVRHRAFDTAEDLDGAIEATRSALTALGDGNAVRRARYLGMLGSALTTRDRETDLDDAIDSLRTAVGDLSSANPEQAAHLHSLGIAYSRRSERTGASADSTAALEAIRTAARSITASTALRVEAAANWARVALHLEDSAEALAGYQQVMELLPLLTWRGLSRADRERLLDKVSGTPSDAAAVAISAGQPERAVELLEQGRTVLWSQLLDDRGDLSELRAARPDLADRLAEVRSALDLNAVPADVPGRAEVPRPDPVALAREWDRLVAEIRDLPGFADYLRPRRFATLAQAASEGPVVIVNLSSQRCDALIVTGEGVEVLPLPALVLTDMIDLLNGVYASFSHPPADIGEVMDNHRLITTVLGWLWTVVTGPVLDRLDGARRVWWCPTGYLALFPVHAATDPATGESALDRVVSSYTPTLRALLTARERVAPASADVLVVAVPRTPGAPDLDVLPEVKAIVDGVHGRPTVLIGPDATYDQVREQLPRHSWVHFACHGAQNLSAPSESALLLQDKPLSVLALTGLRPADAELAFLSACQTAGGGAVLVDEAVHLAAALQVGGFRHVIATLWPLYDSIAPEVTRHFYGELPTEGTAGAAKVLHDAVRALRDGSGRGLPATWAPYIHIGP